MYSHYRLYLDGSLLHSGLASTLRHAIADAEHMLTVPSIQWFRRGNLAQAWTPAGYIRLVMVP